MKTAHQLQSSIGLDEVPEGSEGLGFLMQDDVRRQVYPWTERETRFDNAAWIPPHSFARDAVMRCIMTSQEMGGEFPAENMRVINECRERVGRLLGCTAEDIGFTQNTGDSIAELMRNYHWKPGMRILVPHARYEYPSNSSPWKQLEGSHGIEVIPIGDERTGFVQPDDVTRALDDRTALVTLSSVGYANGQAVPVSAIGEGIAGYNADHRKGKEGVLFHADAVQQIGAKPLDVGASRLNAVSAGTQKWMMGGDGLSILFLDAELRRRMREGGRVPRTAYSLKDWSDPDSPLKEDAGMIEYGTKNSQGIWALHASADLMLRLGVETIHQRIQGLIGPLIDGLQERGYVVTSPQDPEQRSGIVMASKPRWEEELSTADSIAAIQRLGQGFQREVHNALNPSGQKPITYSVSGGRMRLGIHYYNTQEEVTEFLSRLPQAA